MRGGYHGRIISKKINYENEYTKIIDVPKEDINWTTVSLSEVLERDKRLEASTFNINRKHALDQLNQSKYSLVQLSSPEGGLQECFYGARCKRNYISNIDDTSIGFFRKC